MTGSSTLPDFGPEQVGSIIPADLDRRSLTRDEILRALEDVPDPEFSASIVDMGLVVDAWESSGTVYLKLTFTSMGCPAVDMILDDVRQRLLTEPWVEHIDIEVVWDPIWTSQRLTDEGKLALHEMGIVV